MAFFACSSPRSREEDWNKAEPNCSTKFRLTEGEAYMLLATQAKWNHSAQKMLRNTCKGTGEPGMKSSKEMHGASTQGIGLKPISNGCWLREAMLLLQKVLASCYSEPTENNLSLLLPPVLIQTGWLWQNTQKCLFWRTILHWLSVQCTGALLAYHVMAAAPQKATAALNFTQSFFRRCCHSLTQHSLQTPLGLTRWFLRSCFPLSDVSRKENQLRITSSSRISSW